VRHSGWRHGLLTGGQHARLTVDLDRAARVAAAHTIPRELRAVTGEVLRAIRFDTIAVPALLIAGGDSPAYFRRDIDAVARALPDARVAVIDGQQHVADVLAPQTFAEHVLRFLAERA
jgi:pimeloyl-ACP methyl ester carboxylesterase